MSSGEEDDTSAAMAAMMGFSSFGAQDRPSKKRRFNPRADAAIEHHNGAGGKLPQPRPAGTGANSAPLGAPRHSSNLPLHPRGGTDDDDGAAGAGAKSNADEIALDDDDDDGTGRDGDGGDRERQPQYIDTSRPVGYEEPVDPEGEAHFQAQIDAVVAAGNAAYSSAASGVDDRGASTDQRGFRRGGPHVQGPGTSRGGVAGRGRGGHHGGGGPLGEWWIDYYDPGSNENPWAKLEGQLGLQAQGSWLARGERVG